jgi:hypothetical protein
MDLNTSLLIDLLVVAVAAEIIALQTVQMIKGYLSSSKWIPLLSLPICLGIGVVFTHYFTVATWDIGLVVGFFAWIGADALYKALSKGIKLAGWTETAPTPINDPNITE